MEFSYNTVRVRLIFMKLLLVIASVDYFQTVDGIPIEAYTAK